VPTFIGLLKLTDQGLRNIKDVVAERQQNITASVRPDIERSGGRIIGGWWTQGAYDAAVVAEFPDAESASVSKFLTSMRGNWRGEQMRAFTLEEMEQIVQKLP
jgi:uncharacterized protein with GYD domain